MQKDIKKEVGERITILREEMGITKEELAKEIGVSGQFIGMVEKGKSCLSYSNLEKLCKLTGYPSDYILFGKNEKLIKNTDELLNKYTILQIQHACIILSDIAMFIKNHDIS